MKSILTVIGTRPEAIKLAPVLSAINDSRSLKAKVCITGQHTGLLAPLLQNLKIQADYQLDTHENGGTLQQNASSILKQFEPVLAEVKPDVVLVQGDTTTAFAAALSAFYARIPVAHVEAGLRTSNLEAPWPEEAHRCLIARLATYYFAPTEKAKEALISEGFPPEKIWVVGNTSIDAIRILRKSSKTIAKTKFRSIVVTVHRRENQGEPLKEICHALRCIARKFLDVKILFFLHPNPSVREPAIQMLAGEANIELTEPLDHISFVQLLEKSTFVITDSGGIQEEAPFMGKPLVITRETTERPEGIQAGTAKLVGTNSSDIVACCTEMLENAEILIAMSKVHFPYGDGYAAEKIVNILRGELK